MKSLSSYVSSVRQRAAALFHRNDQIKSDAAERQRGWDQVIANHRRPLDPPKDPGKVTLTKS